MTEKSPAARAGRSPVRKFNPGTLQSDRDVMDQFVVRNRELDTVLEILHGNIESPSCQHVLIVAPRGRGKTMLLARAEAELRTKGKFSRFLLPVRFMEESHEVFDVADFWLETLFHLARESATSHPELARELRETHSDLSGRWRERSLGDHARAAVLDAAERVDRKLVLMVENLQTLCGNVDDDFGWQLRAALQSEPRIMLLASATSRFEGLDDAEEPFFELFRIIDLKPLATEGCRRLWQTVSGDRVSGRDIRPLEILTGGNPRLLVVVAGFSEHRSLRALMEALVSLIDEHTEYFRGHLEALPKSERRVYIAIMDLWRPSSTGEIATRARMDVRVVSTMLGRLIDRGAVMAGPSGGGRKRFYSAAEPLYSIYYKLRRERDEAAVVESLIQFMVAFYDFHEVFQISEQLWREVRDSGVIRAGIDRALARRTLGDDLRLRMKWDRVKDASEKVWNHRRAMAEIRLQEEVSDAFREEKWGRVIELVDEYVAGGWDRYRPHMRDHEDVYLAHLRSDAYFGMGEFEKVIAIGAEIVDRFRETRDVFVKHRSAIVLFRKVAAHFRLREFRETIANAKDLTAWIGECHTPDLKAIVAETLILQAESETEMGHFGAAVFLLDEVLGRFGDSDETKVKGSVVRALLEKANNVRIGYDDVKTAASIYDEAIELAEHMDVENIGASLESALLNRGFARGQLGEFDAEIDSYQKLIDRSRQSGTQSENWQVALALSFKAMRQAEMGFADESLDTCDEFDCRFGAIAGEEELAVETKLWLEWRAKGIRALALMGLGRRGAAMDAFRSAYAAFLPYHEIAIREMLRIVPELIAAGASEQDLIEALSTDDKKSRRLAPLIVALLQRRGDTVRVPAEVRGVAVDISKSIQERIDKGVRPGFGRLIW